MVKSWKKQNGIPAGVASLSTWRGPGATVPPCVWLCSSPSRVWRRPARGEALGRRSPRVALLVCPWCELASGRCTVARPPLARRHVLYLFNVAWQEAKGEVGAYFSPWLRTRAQAQEVRPGQLADKAFDESEWTSWSSGWRIGPRNQLIQPVEKDKAADKAQDFNGQGVTVMHYVLKLVMEK